MKYLITLILLTALKPASGFTSYTGAAIISGLTDTDAVAVKKQSVAAGINYGSDVSYFGRTSQNRYPFVTTDVIYNAKSGLFVYGSAWKVLSSIPAVDEVDLGGGYSYKLSKKIKGSISYTRFIFDDQAEVIRSGSTNDINFKNSFNWKFLKSGVTLDYLFGKTNDFFLTISNSKYFETNWSIFDKKDYLSFEPGFNVIIGTQNFAERFPGHYNDLADHHMDPENYPQAFSAGSVNPNTRFNLLNYSIKLPVAYNRPHYTFEAAYKYSVPVNVQGSLLNSPESLFNLTFYYVFY